MSRFLLIAITHLLYDGQENVVYEFIATLNKLLEFGLLSKEDSLDHFKMLLPFVLYRNIFVLIIMFRHHN